MRYLLISIILIFFLITACEKPLKVDKKIYEIATYDVVFRESLAGTYKKWNIGENSFGFSYKYKDRGRGPNYVEEITLNENNFIIEQSIKGVNYLKDSISEIFLSEGSTASWVNVRGENEGSFHGDELYFRYDGSPATYEVLGQLLLASNSKKVSLFPQGEVQLIEELTFALQDTIIANLCVIKGLDIKPCYLWMDENGQMMAKISGNLHVVRDDLKFLRLEMKEIQDSIENEYLFKTAKDLSHKFDKALIKNANVFTAEGALLLNKDVLIIGNTIKAITQTGKGAPSDADIVIDATGKTLMPGLFDSHTHNDKFRGALHIAGGITSVRDLANNKQLKSLSHQFHINEIIGPRIVTYCGIIDGSGPFANQRNVVDSLEEGLNEIQVYKDLGYQQIKLYSSIRPEWVEPMIKKAHSLGMRVCGHIPAFMTASQAISKGYNEIQHINMLLLNFLSDTIDTRTPLRFTMVAEHSADLDLKSDEYLNFVELLKSNRILVDPTVSIFEDKFVSKKGEPSPTYSKIIDRLPLINQRKYYSGGLPKAKGMEKRYKQSFDKMLEVVFDLYQKGVQIVPGTDGLPGFLFHRELELYAKAGIPAVELLKLATIKSAEITGVSELYGSIEVGKQADLILIDGNPIENISDIRKVEWTMKGGNIYYAKELYASMGIKHFK